VSGDTCEVFGDTLEIIIDLPLGFPINNIISLSLSLSLLGATCEVLGDTCEASGDTSLCAKIVKCQVTLVSTQRCVR